MAPMSARVLKLEGYVQHVRIMTIYCGPRVFSIIDFINLVCKSESENYARRLWPHLKPLFEIHALVVVVPPLCKRPEPTREGGGGQTAQHRTHHAVFHIRYSTCVQGSTVNGNGMKFEWQEIHNDEARVDSTVCLFIKIFHRPLHFCLTDH